MKCKFCKGTGIVCGTVRTGCFCPVCCGTGNVCGTVEIDDTKTLLDEFAIAAMSAIISKTPHGTYEDYEVNELNSPYNMTAGGAYSYAASMMKERNLYNDDGTLKEEATEQ